MGRARQERRGRRVFHGDRDRAPPDDRLRQWRSTRTARSSCPRPPSIRAFRPKQLKDFKVYLPGDPTGFDAAYLGQDAFTGWHFVRAEPKLAALGPVTAWAAAGRAPVPALADEVWGIGLRNKDEDFTPLLPREPRGLIQALPQRTAIAQQEVAGPGLPVFNRDGGFVGLAASSFGQTFLQFSQAERGGTPIMLVDVEESSAFLLRARCCPTSAASRGNVYGRPLAWLGAYGLEPMDREVANSSSSPTSRARSSARCWRTARPKRRA